MIKWSSVVALLAIMVLGLPAVSAAAVPIDVPEPGTAVLLVSGAGMLAVKAWRNRGK